MIGAAAQFARPALKTIKAENKRINNRAFEQSVTNTDYQEGGVGVTRPVDVRIHWNKHKDGSVFTKP
ncbi:hypothetical protein EVAR_12475_1 [Eumeta japonica]|uniref:Uncharacterized protein n=1 Tax=Eumeta variegata TaxID=151549 RepID=A0A4C1TPI9_EUMVA|nr:hypothetical protein EVAR_12475_1 [Eumeta japonica]